MLVFSSSSHRSEPMAPRLASLPVDINPGKHSREPSGNIQIKQQEEAVADLSAALLSTSISSTFRTRATDFLKKYYCSRRDLPRELQENDVVEDYQLGPIIGKGAFSCVRRAVNRRTNDVVAIKIINKDAEDEVVDMVANETAVWSTVEHPNILRLIRVIETPTEMCIISELMEGGNLLNYIIGSPNGRLSEDEAQLLFKQLFSVLDACHSRGVVHGDIKPDNILMSADHKHIKLCDFGLSQIVDRTKSPLFDRESRRDPDDDFSSSSQPRSGSVAGTPLFLAPEIIRFEPTNGTQADMWSAGVTLFAALTGRYPFDDDFTPRLQQMILSCNYVIPDFVSADARDLIHRLLNKDPEQRLQAREAVKHRWVTCGISCSSSGSLASLGSASTLSCAAVRPSGQTGLVSPPMTSP